MFRHVRFARHNTEGRQHKKSKKHHHGHRREVKRCEEGMGANFNSHAVQMGLDVNSQMDDVMKYIEEVSMNILQDQVSLNIHSKAGVFKYITMEIPL